MKAHYLIIACLLLSSQAIWAQWPAADHSGHGCRGSAGIHLQGLPVGSRLFQRHLPKG